MSNLGCITEYLYCVPHLYKFQFPETEKLLSRNVSSVADFDPLDASDAFEDLAKYIHNLLEQPWRADFFRIKLYSGFYMHKINAYLESAEVLLNVLGYVQADDDENALILPRAPDPVVLVAVLRDCYIASQECLILSLVWQRVQKEIPDYPLTVYEAYRIRKKTVGDVETIAEKLICEAHEKMHQYFRGGGVEKEELLAPQQQEYWKSKLEPKQDVPVERLIEVEVQDHSTRQDSTLKKHIDEIAKRVIQHTAEEQHGIQKATISNILISPNTSIGPSLPTTDASTNTSPYMEDLQSIDYEPTLSESKNEISFVSDVLEEQKFSNFTLDSSPQNIRKDQPTEGILTPTPYKENFPKVNAFDVRSRITSFDEFLLEDRPHFSQIASSSTSSISTLIDNERHERIPQSKKPTSSSFKGVKNRQDFPKLKMHQNQMPSSSSKAESNLKKQDHRKVTAETTNSLDRRHASHNISDSDKGRTFHKPKALTRTKLSFDEYSDSILDETVVQVMEDATKSEEIIESENEVISKNLSSSMENIKAEVSKVIGLPLSSSTPKKAIIPWNCPHCTFYNEIADVICEICSKTNHVDVSFNRDLAASAFHESSGDWTLVGLNGRKSKNVPLPTSDNEYTKPSSQRQHIYPSLSLSIESETKAQETRSRRKAIRSQKTNLND